MATAAGSGVFSPFVFLGTNHTVLCIEGRNPEKVVWKRELPSGMSHDTNIFFYNDVLYVGCNGNVYALNPETGNSLWEKSRSDLDFCRGIPDFSMFKNDTLVAVCSNCVVGLDARTGDVKFNEKCKKVGNGYGTHYLDEDRVVNMTSGSLYCRSLKNSEEIWKNTFSMKCYDVFTMFRTKLKGVHEEDTLVVGTSGKVISLNRETGEVLRTTGLKGTGYNIVTVVHNTFDPERRTMIVGSRGKLFCMDIATHEVVWENPLKGCGRDRVHSILLWEDHGDAPPSYEDVVLLDTEDAGADTPLTESFGAGEHSKLILLAMNGAVMGIAPETGEMVFRTALKGSSYSFVGMVLSGGMVHIGTNGKYFQLDARTGKCLARIPIKGVGFSPVSVATTTGHYDMNFIPLTQYRYSLEQQNGAIAATM